MRKIATSIVDMKPCGYFLLLPLLLSSCAIPVNSPNTARPLGEGRLHMSTSIPIPSVAVRIGVSQNFDMGLSVESQLGPIFDLFGKYTFAGGREGQLSLAIFGGGFNGIAEGGYAGPIISYKAGWFEPYLTAVYKSGKWSDVEVSESDDDLVIKRDKIYEGATFSYLQSTVGVNLWLSEGFSLELSRTLFKFYGSLRSSESDPLDRAALNWHF